MLGAMCGKTKSLTHRAEPIATNLTMLFRFFDSWSWVMSQTLQLPRLGAM